MEGEARSPTNDLPIISLLVYTKQTGEALSPVE